MKAIWEERGEYQYVAPELINKSFEHRFKEKWSEEGEINSTMAETSAAGLVSVLILLYLQHSHPSSLCQSWKILSEKKWNKEFHSQIRRNKETQTFAQHHSGTQKNGYKADFCCSTFVGGGGAVIPTYSQINSKCCKIEVVIQWWVWFIHLRTSSGSKQNP